MEEKVQKEKKSKKALAITISIIAAVILIVAIVVAIILLQGRDDKNDKVSTGNEYGDATLKILDSEEIAKYEKVKLSFSDLDLDGVQELIIKYLGLKVEDEDKANQQIKIYKLNDKKQYENKVNNGVDGEKSTIDLEFVYNKVDKKYQWLEKVDDTEKTVYYEIENQLNNKNETDKKYDEGSDEFKEKFNKVDTEKSKEIEISGELSKEELADKIKEAVEGYIPTDTMIENKKELKISKIDESKDIVYTALKEGNLEYPIININDKNIKAINDEIKLHFGFNLDEVRSGEFTITETEEISYKYYVNENILSLVIKRGGNDSTWCGVYNIDLNDNSKLTSDKLIAKTNFKKSEIIDKLTSICNQYFESDIQKSKSEIGVAWSSLGYDNELAKWKEDMHTDISNLERMYLNENGDLCVVVEFKRPGGQWSCTHSVMINISKNYKTTELTYKSAYPNVDNTQTTSATPVPTATPTVKPKVSPTPTNKIANITFDNSSSDVIPNGVYKRGEDGTLTITNSKPGSFDFKIFCTYMTQAGYPNLGELSGTAKATTDGNFAYVERKSNGDNYNYNVVFYVAGGASNATITIKDEDADYYTSPYCGHNVTFEGTFKK